MPGESKTPGRGAATHGNRAQRITTPHLGWAMLLMAILAAPRWVYGAESRQPLVLTGQALSIEQVLEVAEQHRRVELSPEARARVAAAFEVVLAAAHAKMAVYGLTTGVGWNKDKAVLGPVGALDPELLAISRRFNIGTLRAHAAGVGPLLPDEVVRAAMLVRLNLLLSGAGGVQPAVADQYAVFLNRDITPVVPERGSVGEADILQSSHIGLALAGEWQVHVRSTLMPAAQALHSAGLKPVELVGKDFLAIIGDNSLTIARALFALRDVRAWLQGEITIFALSLEGLDGNVAPFLEVSVAAHPEPGFTAVARQLRAALAGSDLWNASERRPLQDPLSFRTMPIVLGVAWEALQAAETEALFAASHSADNPLVLTEAGTLEKDGAQAVKYLVPGAGATALVPTGNFEALPLASALERLSLALGHVSESITASVLRFENPTITGLPRFLTAPDNPGHGFGAVQKAMVVLNSEIRTLALPVSLDGATLAGNVEDVSNNGPLAVGRLAELTDDLYELASLQMLHAAQAVDLRSGFHLGAGTEVLRSGYRARVPFVAQDRILTGDIEAGVQYLRELPPLEVSR
jgi:histidine ammonia-lyase